MYEFFGNSDLYDLEYLACDTGDDTYNLGVIASADIENDSVSGDGSSTDNSTSDDEASVATATESGTLTDYQNSVLELAKAQVNLSMITAFGVFLILGIVLARIVWRKL